MASKLYYCTGNVTLFVRKAKPPVVVGTDILEPARPAIKYTLKKLKGGSVNTKDGKSFIPGGAVPYTVETVTREIKKLHKSVTQAEVDKMLEYALENPKLPVYTKTDWLRRTKGEFALQQEEKMVNMAAEIEELKLERKELQQRLSSKKG